MRAKLRRDHRWVPTPALFDCGATHSMIHPDILTKDDWAKVTPSNIQLRNASGSIMPHQGIIDKLIMIHDSTGYSEWCRASCLVTDSGEKIVLGMDWTKQYELVILSWTDGLWRHPVTALRLSLIMSRKKVRRIAKSSAVGIVIPLSQTRLHQETANATIAVAANIRNETPPSNSSPIDISEPPINLSQPYNEFRDVFSTIDAGILPSLNGRTHAIELEQGKTPPWGPIYSLAEKELEVLREYLASAQKKGWIRRSTSPAGAPILFVPKKGGW